MSSTQGSSDIANGKKKTSDRNRRCWTAKEDATLVAALKDLIVNGWKSDNGFRAGYLNKLEAMMQKADPNTDLKAQLHICSKLCNWKKNYYSITNMLLRSGIGYNTTGTDYMISCEDETWELMMKIDPNTRLLRHKAWPLYDDWKTIFGKDRATGETAEDVNEASNELNSEERQIPREELPVDHDESYEHFQNEAAYDQVSQSARDGQGGIAAPKKARMNTELQNVCELLNDMNQSTNARLEHLATRIGYEFDMGKARQETFDQLGEIPGLSLENRFVVCEMVTFKAERLDIWRGMKNEARAQYVEHLLKSRNV